MEKQYCDKCDRWVCGILFCTFTFCWLFFFQKDLVCSACNRALFDGECVATPMSYYHLTLTLVVTALAMFFVLPGKTILGFRRGLYACNYILSALFLGIVTGYDGESVFGQNYLQWILVATFSLLLLTVSKIISNVPKSSYNSQARSLLGNFLIMTLLFSMIAYLSNVDENFHRRLRMEYLMYEADYEGVLKVGADEEETDTYIDLLRAKAMLSVPVRSNPEGSGIGDNLFAYRMASVSTLSDSLKAMQSDQAILASLLLDCDLTAFSDSIRIESYSVMPRYYMEALILSSDTIASQRFPDQYAAGKAAYDEFLQALEPIRSEPLRYQANSTFIKYGKTYFWYYTFHK